MQVYSHKNICRLIKIFFLSNYPHKKKSFDFFFFFRQGRGELEMRLKPVIKAYLFIIIIK